MKHIFLEIDEDTHTKLKVKAYSEGKTITFVLRKLIEKYVNGEISL